MYYQATRIAKSVKAMTATCMLHCSRLLGAPDASGHSTSTFVGPGVFLVPSTDTELVRSHGFGLCQQNRDQNFGNNDFVRGMRRWYLFHRKGSGIIPLVAVP